jgi:hypothetical protein
LVQKIISLLEELSCNNELRERSGLFFDLDEEIPNADDDVFVIH